MDSIIELGSLKEDTQAATVNYPRPDGLVDSNGNYLTKPCGC